MAVISNKNQNLVPIQFNPVGGLNLALPHNMINESEMHQANNVIYLPHSGQIAVRPGFSCLTQTKAPGAILNMHPFENQIICSVDDGKVYAYNIVADTFTPIHDIGASLVATFLTFNSLLLMADGAGLYKWNGSDPTEEITKLIHPTMLAEINNRVVINDMTDRDAVFMSGPEDEEDWDTVTGAAVMLRAGYGDGMNVNGLAVLGTDLIVSKAGSGKKFIYRVSTAGQDPTQWSVHKLITDTSANNKLLIESIPNTVMYVNEDSELRSLVGVQEYGDIRMINIGEKINPLLASVARNGFPATMIRYSPAFDMLVMIYSGMVAFYFHASKRFTTLTFDEGDVRCCCDFSDELFWGGHNGHIYRWNESSAMDESEPGVLEIFEASIKSKLYSFPAESLVKRSGISISNFVEGAGTVRINSTKIIDFEILGSPWYVFDADDTLLYDANMKLYDRGEADTIKKAHNRCRQNDFFIHVSTSEGRMGLNYVDLIVSQVNG